jgi:hypothetical protein
MAERKGKKLRRCTALQKAYYKLQFGMTDHNKKKKVGKHIRNHPESVATMSEDLLAKVFGPNFRAVVAGHLANVKAKVRVRKARNAAKQAAHKHAYAERKEAQAKEQTA